MDSSFKRFKAFYRTSSLWQHKLLGIQQFPLSNFKFDLLEEQEALALPNIPAGTVLGKRAEYYFKFCIEQSDNYELLLANLQIFQGKITLGELDYLIREKSSQQLLHIELVYKFYCYDPAAQESHKDPVMRELSRYRGPNNRDHLLRKLTRLKEHQFPLLYHANTLKSLEQDYGISLSKVRQYACFLAHVFIPRHLWQQDFPHINKGCIVGYYLSVSAFAKAHTSNTYYLPRKHAWKMLPHQLKDSYNHAEVLEIVSGHLENGFASMVWMEWEENKFERFFVVQ